MQRGPSHSSGNSNSGQVPTAARPATPVATASDGDMRGTDNAGNVSACMRGDVASHTRVLAMAGSTVENGSVPCSTYAQSLCASTPL